MGLTEPITELPTPEALEVWQADIARRVVLVGQQYTDLMIQQAKQFLASSSAVSEPIEGGDDANDQ